MSRLPSQHPPGHPFIIDSYVKDRIAHAMRTEDAKRDDGGEQQRRTPQQSQMHHSKDVDRSSTPGDNAASNSTDDDQNARLPPRSTANLNGMKINNFSTFYQFRTTFLERDSSYYYKIQLLANQFVNFLFVCSE